jgi:hypothetical protein
MFATLRGDEAALKTREELAQGAIPATLAKFDEIIAAHGGKYVVGRLTIADLKLFALGRLLGSGFLQPIPKNICEPFANFSAMFAEVAANPKIAAWYASKQ